MNIGIFSGNLTKDVRTMQSQGGMSMAFFTLAVNSGFGDKQHTDYVDAAIFGKRAEGGLIQYLTKGQQVIVTGNVILETREHEGKEYKNMKLNVSEIDLVGGKPAQAQQQPAQNNSAPSDFDDGIPF